LKTKDELIDTVKQWYAEIADLWGKYQLLVVMRGFAGENMSHEIHEFFTDKGVKSYFSTPYEPWQDGLGEAGIKSVLLLARTEMAESGLAGSLPSTMERIAEIFTFKYRLGTICAIKWDEEGCFKIQTFGMQSICSSEQGEERERKTYTSCGGSNSPGIRFRLQYERVQILYFLVQKMHCIKSSPI
jgi:hypothetical protein